MTNLHLDRWPLAARKDWMNNQINLTFKNYVIFNFINLIGVNSAWELLD